jgi:hypothetical protein
LATVEVNPAGSEVQLYVFPGTAATPIWVLAPVQIDLFGPVWAGGRLLIVTFVVAVTFPQPPDVASVYETM